MYTEKGFQKTKQKQTKRQGSAYRERASENGMELRTKEGLHAPGKELLTKKKKKKKDFTKPERKMSV